MKLGMFTACLEDLTLEEIAAWASAHGFEAIEAAAWPSTTTRPFTCTHIDAESMTADDATKVLNMLEGFGLTLSSLGFYENNLHPDPNQRDAVNRHLLSCIDAAALLGCPTVGTFIGRDPNLPVPQNLRNAERIFAPIVERAHERNVKVVIENCVMEGWHPDGYPGNLAYSPELWEWLTSIGLYLNFDPSHLVWMGIDPVSVIPTYADHIAHVQAKDVQIFPEARNRYGYPGKAVSREDPWDSGWWRYRIPGLGEVNWVRLIDALYEAGYDGVVSVEHEDPIWGGTEARVKTGLQFAHSTLRPLIIG